jgi:anti-sigma regulatory factor (Ser/Thr protein kinase)
MNGSRQTPPGRPVGDIGSAGTVVPDPVQHSVNGPHPPPWQERSRSGQAIWSPLSHLELGPLDSAVPSARLHARLVLQGWGFPDEFTQTVELLVSEFVTNAVFASQALLASQVAREPVPTPIHLWMRADGDQVTVTVWDANPQLPERTDDVSADAEGGRGLLLVEALSERWGCTETPHLGGKSVWCIVVPKDMG